jgi:hypothetical protein
VRTARLAAAALATGLAAALAACAAPAEQPLGKVGVRLLQYRSDIAPHRLQLQVVNGSPTALVVRRARLLASGYRPAPAWTDPVPAEIPAGATVDLPAPLGAAACHGTATPRAELTLSLQGGTRTVTVPTVDSHGTLAALHRADCFAERAARVATFAFTAITPGGGRNASLTLDVRPGPEAGQGLQVVRVLPTTLLSPPAGRTEWEVGRPAGVTADPLVLPAVPTRCDLHAIAEDKVGSVLPVEVRLADGTSGVVQVVAAAAVRDDVLRWVSDTCATGR